MAFVASMVFEIVSKTYFQNQEEEVDTNTTTGQRRDTDVGFKRFYDENEIDVGLGKVKDANEVLNDGDTIDISAPHVNILYCIG